MPRVKLFDVQQAMEQALDLFWQKGYESTSLADLTKHLNLGKGSFYDTFGSKKQLFKRCMNFYQSSSLEILDSILTEYSDPVEGIRHLLGVHSRMMLKDQVFKGCFIANSTTELAADDEMNEFLKDHNRIVRSKLIQLFQSSPYEKESGTIADLVITQMTGISVMSRVVKDPHRFIASNELFMKVLLK